MSLLVFFLFMIINKSLAWEGILIDGQNGTQLFTIENSMLTATDSQPNFKLPHLHGSVGVMLHGLAYFIGGQDTNNTYQNVVTIFDPQNNETTIGSNMTYPR